MKINLIGSDLSVVIDEDDNNIISQYKWYLHKCGKYRYAVGFNSGGKRKNTFMHRLLMNAQRGEIIE